MLTFLSHPTWKWSHFLFLFYSLFFKSPLILGAFFETFQTLISRTVADVQLLRKIRCQILTLQTVHLKNMEVSDLVGLPLQGARQQTSQSHPLPSDEHSRDCKILIKFVPCIYYCPLLLLDKKCVFLWIMYLSTCRHNLLMLKLTTGRLYHSSDIFQQQSPAVSTSSLMKKTERKKPTHSVPKVIAYAN